MKFQRLMLPDLSKRDVSKPCSCSECGKKCKTSTKGMCKNCYNRNNKRQKAKNKIAFPLFTLLIVLMLSACIPAPIHAATYKGVNIDGQYYSAVCTDHEHQKPYHCLVLFDGDQCKIVFNNGGYITVTLTSEEIDDLNFIEGVDYKTYFFWYINLDTDD